MRKKYTHDLVELKGWALEHVQESKMEGLEGDSDFIDVSIADDVKKINTNPLLVTTGSCSGHDGIPFISVVFLNDRARDHYVALMEKEGFDTAYSGKYRLGFFAHNFRTRVVEEVSFGKKRVAVSEKGSKRAWKAFVRVLGKGIPCHSP
jgi:hypothetical protein